MIASYAGKVFSVDPRKINTFTDFQYASAILTEKQDSDSTKISSSKSARFSKPSTYIKGCDLDTIGLKITLDVVMGVNPRNEWGEWKRICESTIAYPFILGGIPLSGGANFLLNNVAASNMNIDNSGNILSLELSLKFEEYFRAGAKKDSSASSSKGTVDLSKELMSFTDEDDKESLKRDNPGMPADILDANVPDYVKQAVRRSRGM
ncbi:MAG TPA: hypothetical protein VF941_23770 [Clostridia bacterium]